METNQQALQHAKETLERLKKQREDGSKYFKMEEGQQKDIEWDLSREVKTTISKFEPEKTCVLLPILVDGQPKEWERSGVDDVSLSLLEHVSKGKTKFTVVRNGTGKKTTYTIVVRG